MTDGATESNPQSRRHGCLTAWLIFGMAANSLSAWAYSLTLVGANSTFAYLPRWALLMFVVGATLNVVCLCALFAWKKWGFWGLCALTVVGFVINLSIGVNPGLAVLGLVGPAVLYGVLNIGEQNKGWTRLT